MEIDKTIKGYYPSGYYPNTPIKEYEHNKSPAYVAGDLVAYKGYVYVLTNRIGTSTPSYPDTQLDNKGFRVWTLYKGSRPATYNTVQLYDVKLHGTIQYPSLIPNYYNVVYDLELGLYPKPEHPELVNIYDDNTYSTYLWGGSGYHSIHYLKRSEVSFNYIRRLPAMGGEPSCWGIFDYWGKAVRENGMQDVWAWAKAHPTEAAAAGIPAEIFGVQVGGYSASPAYEAGGIYMEVPYIPCAMSSPPYPIYYGGEPPRLPENGYGATSITITYSKRMYANNYLYLGRTYTGYIRYYIQKNKWVKFDESDIGNTPILCTDGSDSGHKYNEWFIGNKDKQVPESITEYRIPISYTITERDITISDAFISREDAPDYESHTVALLPDMIISNTEMVLETVSPDFYLG